ncbi:MAG: DUF721 domain-containing protein [Nitrospiraceae bacterium]|nr:MAG: DUF721 domain-containing protein [Nitrospiraceae bacterium]
MQSLHGILKILTKSYGLEGGVALNALRRRWVEVVGQTVSVHTSPDTIKGKVLTLIVDTPQWMHHLSFFKEEITAKLKPYNVSDIRFRIGRLPEETEEAREKEQAGLNEEDKRYIENTLKNLKDEELKEKFRTLIAHGLTKGKK